MSWESNVLDWNSRRVHESTYLVSNDLNMVVFLRSFRTKCIVHLNALQGWSTAGTALGKECCTRTSAAASMNERTSSGARLISSTYLLWAIAAQASAIGTRVIPSCIPFYEQCTYEVQRSITLEYALMHSSRPVVRSRRAERVLENEAIP